MKKTEMPPINGMTLDEIEEKFNDLQTPADALWALGEPLFAQIRRDLAQIDRMAALYEREAKEVKRLRAENLKLLERIAEQKENP